MKIPFEENYRKKFYNLCEKVFDSNFLSEGKMNETFANNFGKFNDSYACTVSNCGDGLLALLEYCNVKGKEVILPSNTFMADYFAVQFAGAKSVLADCNKNDLCLSAKDLEKRITKKTAAVIVVHIGGYIAFDIFKIVKICKKYKIPLIEDCAHSHGAIYKGKKSGSFGIGGSYSFYSTKTMPLGDGGMVVSKHKKVIEFVKKFSNYSKWDYKPRGLNCRMSEIIAAFGIVQLQRLPKILNWKKRLAKNTTKFLKTGYNYQKTWYPVIINTSFLITS